MKSVALRRMIVTSVGVLAVSIFLPALSQVITSNRFATQDQENPVSITLQPPLFIHVARAETSGVAAFTDEAGISAYLNLGQAVNLSVVDDVCRTVETSNSDYFLCNVGIPDYSEGQDVKVYVDKTGWALAYYPRGQATGKIFDWKHYDGGTSIPTTLDQALTRVIQKAGSAAVEPTYFHFAYPNANRLMLVAELAESTAGSFQVNLPSAFSYFERSWSFLSTDSYSKYFLDANIITENNSGNLIFSGLLSSSQMSADTVHTISVSPYYNSTKAYAGLALIYQVQ